MLLQVHVEVLGLRLLERFERNARLSEEVESELVLVEHGETDGASPHVLLRDTVVRERLVPLRVQRPVLRLRAQLKRLKQEIIMIGSFFCAGFIEGIQ